MPEAHTFDFFFLISLPVQRNCFVAAVETVVAKVTSEQKNPDLWGMASALIAALFLCLTGWAGGVTITQVHPTVPTSEANGPAEAQHETQNRFLTASCPPELSQYHEIGDARAVGSVVVLLVEPGCISEAPAFPRIQVILRDLHALMSVCAHGRASGCQHFKQAERIQHARKHTGGSGNIVKIGPYFCDPIPLHCTEHQVACKTHPMQGLARFPRLSIFCFSLSSRCALTTALTYVIIQV